MLRKSGKPVMIVVNKIDNVRMMDEIYDFYQLGMGDPIGISSVNLLNFGDLLEELCKLFPTRTRRMRRTGPSRSPWSASPTWAKARWSTASSERSA